jgi:hypothetical protein
MRLDLSTFVYVLFIVTSIILIAHIFIKNSLSEPIFRFEIPKFTWFNNNLDDDVDRDDAEHENTRERAPLKRQYEQPSSPTYVPSPYSPYSPYSPSSPRSPGSPRWLPNPESKKNLIDYIKSNLREVSEVDDYNRKVKGANYYSPYHDSTLHSEETDLSKFFNIYNPVTDTTNALQNVKRRSSASTCKEPQDPLIDFQTGNPLAFDQGSDGTPIYRKDIWTYDNERPMSGGAMDGILPSDVYQDGYAAYPSTNQQLYDNSFETSYPYVQSSGRW